MASVHELALERIQSSVIDGRTETIRFRQDQLQNLHKTLRDEISSICLALTQDSPSSTVEADTEFYLAVDAVRHFYDSLDFQKEIEQEYLIANGKDNKDRRVGAGLVIIRPTTHTRLYSIVNPLAAAISAGNCVILEVSKLPIPSRALLLTRKNSSKIPSSSWTPRCAPSSPRPWTPTPSTCPAPASPTRTSCPRPSSSTRPPPARLRPPPTSSSPQAAPGS